MSRKTVLLVSLSVFLFCALCSPLFCQDAERQMDLSAIEQNLSGRMLKCMDELEAQLSSYQKTTEQLKDDASSSNKITQNLETQSNLFGRQSKNTLSFADSLSNKLSDKERKLKNCRKLSAALIATIALNRLLHIALAILYMKLKIKIPYEALLFL